MHQPSSPVHNHDPIALNPDECREELLTTPNSVTPFQYCSDAKEVDGSDSSSIPYIENPLTIPSPLIISPFDSSILPFVVTATSVVFAALWTLADPVWAQSDAPLALLGQHPNPLPLDGMVHLDMLSSLSTSLATTTTTTAAAATVAHPMLLSDAVSSAVPVDWNTILQKASKRALGGGLAGASAAVVQVLSLMWLRTSMNYQYRYGGTLQSSLQTLWSQGGIGRLYQGLPFAIVQGPLTRFGDTAANVGILVLLDTLPETKDLPLPLKTACASLAAGLWRILLMPIDASKTAMQVEGSEGLQRLWDRVRSSQSPGPLYQGALAQAAATAAGHYPWFLTFNFLNNQLPIVNTSDDLFLSILRSAVMGLVASCVSDVVSNSLRVIKTTKQTAQLRILDVPVDDSNANNRGNNDPPTTSTTTTTQANRADLSYSEVVKMIIEQDGVMGLLGRGLQTRLLTNMIQGAAFSVLWKYFQQMNGMQ